MPASIQNEDFYLGDGLYSAYDGFQVRVYASDGLKVESAVYFDPMVLAVFLGWLQQKCPEQFKHMGKG